MKKIIFAVGLALILSGCVTKQFTPFFQTSDDVLANQKYEVLGMVSVENVVFQGMNTDSPRALVLKEAKKKYPQADDVVDLVYYRSSSTTSVLGLQTDSSNELTIEARAIRYLSNS